MKKYFTFTAFVVIFALFFSPDCMIQKTFAAALNVKTVKASHILVPTKEEADSIKGKIDSGENFAKLAKEYSKCPSGQHGGYLGVFGRGQMVSEFEDAAFNLPVGEVSQPIKTQYGWHLIKVYAKE